MSTEGKETVAETQEFQHDPQYEVKIIGAEDEPAKPEEPKNEDLKEQPENPQPQPETEEEPVWP